jgi:hypothetical protein
MKTKFIKLFEDYTNDTLVVTDKFYLLIEDVRTILNNKESFKKGILVGLKGISENGDISNLLEYASFDIFIEMDKNKVLLENKVIKIEYDNIDFLSKDNFKMFKRIMAHGLNFLNDYKFFIEVINVYKEGYNKFDLEKVNPELYELISSKEFANTLRKENKFFNDINEYSNYVSSLLKTQNPIQIKSDLSNMFLDMVKEFKQEQEWFVMTDNFKIPKGSKIEVYMDFIADNIGEEEIEDCENYFKSLTQYNITFE